MLSFHAVITSIAGFPMLRRKSLQFSYFKPGRDVTTHCPHTQYKGVQGRPWLWPTRMGWKPGQRPNKISLWNECRSAREHRQHPAPSHCTQSTWGYHLPGLSLANTVPEWTMRTLTLAIFLLSMSQIQFGRNIAGDTVQRETWQWYTDFLCSLLSSKMI